jgi:hypothetical protein
MDLKDLKKNITDIKYKQNLTGGQILSKYFAPAGLGNDELASDDNFDEFTKFCTRGTSTIAITGAAIVAVMALFVAATYILALSPALAVPAGLGSSQLGVVAGIAGTLSLTIATVTAIPAAINSMRKGMGDKGEDKFVKEVKSVIDTFVSEKLEGVKTLNHYGLQGTIDNLVLGVQNQLSATLNKKFRDDNKIPDTVKTSIRDTASQLIAKQVLDLKAVTNLPEDKVTFAKVHEITSDITRASGINGIDVEAKAVEVFQSLVPTDKSSSIISKADCEGYKDGFTKRHNRLSIASAVDEQLSSLRTSDSMASQVTMGRVNTSSNITAII